MERFYLSKPDLVNPALDFYITGFDKHVQVCTLLVPLKSGDYQCLIYSDRLEFVSDKDKLDTFGIPFFGFVSLVENWSLSDYFSQMENHNRNLGYIRTILNKSDINVFESSTCKEQESFKPLR